MFENDVRSIVSKSITAHSKGDTISKSELEDILTDVLYRFGNSTELSRVVGKKIADEQKLKRRIQGLR
jgi:hypothetical protein